MVDDTLLDERFLILAPTGRDAALTASLLRKAGLAAEPCKDMDALCREAARGGAALIIAEEVLVPSGLRRLAEVLSHQAAWSDLPVLIFTGEGATIQSRRPTVELLAPLGNVTLLDRPLRPVTMIAAAKAALRARRRQYQGREEMARQTDAVRQRDQFLAMLGHELRNPLAAIVLAGEMLARTSGPSRPVDIIRRQTHHLRRLVDDLLDVARVTSGKVVLQRRTVALDALLERCLQATAGAACEQRLAVSVHHAAVGLAVDGDPVRLEQVFTNLLTNAIKYTPPGGAIVTTLEQRDDWAVVRIRDSGVGIPADMVPRVFDLFTQVEETLDRSQGGLGVGLTLVQRLVELHGGAVWAASAGPGLGSEFSVRLPLRRAASAVVSEPTAAATTASRTARVLVVEDNEDTRELLKALLETVGHTVEVAGDGLEGVQRASSFDPQVAIVDIGLPGLDGYEVARRLREMLGRDITLIAMTGYGQPEDRRRAVAAGFDVHLTKPVDADVLRAISQPPPA
jgi:signal transduction histidine kinase